MLLAQISSLARCFATAFGREDHDWSLNRLHQEFFKLFQAQRECMIQKTFKLKIESGISL